MEQASETSSIPVSLTLYDLLGYIAPGGAVLISAVTFDFLITGGTLDAQGQSQPFRTLFGKTFYSAYRVIPNDHWLSNALFIVAILGIAYILGHIIGSLSSLTIDRCLISKGYGYPYRNLLSIEEETDKHGSYSGAFYRGLFFWVNFGLTLKYFEMCIHHMEGDNLKLAHNIGNYLAKLSLFFIILIIFFRIIIGWKWMRDLGKKERNQARELTSANQEKRVDKTPAVETGKETKAPASIVANSISDSDPVEDKTVSSSKRRSSFQKFFIFLRYFIRRFFIIKVWAGPYDFLGKFLSHTLQTRRAFNPEFRKKYAEAFDKQFAGIDYQKAETNNFWFSYYYVVENSTVLSAHLRNWRTLYIFARNLSTALYCSALYCFFELILQKDNLHGNIDGNKPAALYMPLFLFTVSIIMLLRYYYIYVCYYSKSVFRSFVFLNMESGKVNGKSEAD